MARYGITPEDYERMSKEQGGVCKICGNPPQPGKRYLDVDHSHDTGKVRGLLCGACNKRLAPLENARWREKAEAYLMEYDPK